MGVVSEGADRPANEPVLCPYRCFLTTIRILIFTLIRSIISGKRIRCVNISVPPFVEPAGLSRRHFGFASQR